MRVTVQWNVMCLVAMVLYRHHQEMIKHQHHSDDDKA